MKYILLILSLFILINVAVAFQSTTVNNGTIKQCNVLSTDKYLYKDCPAVIIFVAK